MYERKRIGNLVTNEFYDSFKDIINIESLNDTGINIFASDDGKPYGMAMSILDYEYTYDKLFGIPLTEEWLLKFGGTKTDMGILIELQRGNVMSLNLLLKSCIVSISGAFGLVTLCHIKYVHQLQNLYYDLTEKELTT